MTPFEHKITIHFRQTDMAGIAYFNEALNVFHDTYEAWITAQLGNPQQWFSHPEWAVPLKNVQCEYFAPLLPFETYTVKLAVDHVGTTSFKLNTTILKGDTPCAQIQSAHVFMDKKTRRSTNIPESILAFLKK